VYGKKGELSVMRKVVDALVDMKIVKASTLRLPVLYAGTVIRSTISFVLSLDR
jgi:hypothetical protein